ncbi:MAG: sugar dehydratase [Candidatus Buchananbacteria bacterium RIFCSPHIGHO2_02_FULL_45_11b]|uniref:Sugar dehydratase n=1 Tax=Candidatus Buchananbacteria bacterium RIFCSPHIGHO2_02_FULL_45_11b TaxID=1797541 RepID=A0A1G1YD47_9BACT|nr:MAG: sugar dehydratase [Candidatus Buchananbacteria bacterium RIFCSPHIGHO2_02_FULL_45_11b]
MNKEFWKNKNVLVTGCSGLLGSWLVKYLVDSGAGVVGLIRDIVPKSNLFYSGYYPKINIVRGELEDRIILERILGEYEIDTVFNLGAQAIITIANRNPISTFETNIKGSWNILEACRRSPKVKRIIAASSDKAYGEQSILPYTEETPLKGQYPYDVSKSCADLLAQSYHKTFNTPVCITRCGNFFGGGDLNFNRIVPGTIKSIINNEPPVVRSDGKLVRDYFYIEDAVIAYLTLAEKMEELNLFGQAFNFSNQDPISVIDLANKILRLMDSKLEPIILNQAFGEIPAQYLSAQKANTVLGWQASFNLEEGLKKTVDWYKNFFEFHNNAEQIKYEVI